MWFVKVNQIDCDVTKIQEAKELKCAAWALHPIGKRDIPHYHFVLDLSYKRADSFNEKIRALLLNPKTTSLKSTLVPQKDTTVSHPYQDLIAYLKRFMPCKDVWPTVAYWINEDRIPDYEPGFLRKEEKEKYMKLKFPPVQNDSPQTTTLLPQIITIKPPKKPTQRDIISDIWNDVQTSIDTGFLDQGDRQQMTKFIFRLFVAKMRREKLKFDRYQIIQYMNPIMCEFTKGYEDDLQNQVVEHFCHPR